MLNFVEISKGCAKGLLLALNIVCIIPGTYFSPSGAQVKTLLQCLKDKLHWQKVLINQRAKVAASMLWYKITRYLNALEAHKIQRKKLIKLIALCTFGFAVVDIKLLKQYGEEQAAGCYTGDVVIIVASLLLVVVATLGCVGTGTESVKMLYLYVGSVVVMVLIELLTAIFVSVQRYGLQYRVTEWIRKDFYRNITDDNREQHAMLWDELQTTYECCGLNGPEDYVALNQHISLSCCPRAYRAPSVYAQKLLYDSCVESAIYYKNGCEDEILFILQADADWLIGVAVISFWFEAVGIVLAMWVSSHLKNSVQMYRHTVKY